ncbi:hypothetical protein DUNSADRAFT_6668, partial [Dunaliella salina]
VDSTNAAVEGVPEVAEIITGPSDHKRLMQQESAGSKMAVLLEESAPDISTGSPDVPSHPSTPGAMAEEPEGLGGQCGIHSHVRSPLATEPATDPSDELAEPDAPPSTQHEQGRARKQPLMHMDGMNVPSALRCGTGFAPKKPRRNQFQPTPISFPSKAEQGTFVQQMHRRRRMEQQQEQGQADTLQAGLYGFHPSFQPLTQASKWRSPNKADASLVALPSSALGHNSAHQAWQNVPGGAFQPLTSPSRQPDPSVRSTPLSPPAAPLSPSSAHSPRRKQQPQRTARASPTEGLDTFGGDQDSPTIPGKPSTAVPGSKWGYPSTQPRKPLSALSRSSPTPLGNAAGKAGAAAASAGPQPSANKAATLHYQPHLYPENR